MPPRVAPITLVIVPIYRNPVHRENVLKMARQCKEIIGDAAAVTIDDREQYTPGWKFNEWDLKGVPLRMEIGPKEVTENRVMLVRRDQPKGSWKDQVSLSGLRESLVEILKDIQNSLFEKCRKFRDDNTVEVDDFAEFSAKMESPGVFARSHWCGSPECEAAIKDQTKATIRCIPSDESAKPGDEQNGKCILCGKESGRRVIFARAY